MSTLRPCWRILGLAALCLASPACLNSSVPPHLRSTSIRLGGRADFQNLEVGRLENTGPHPAIDIGLDTLFLLEDTTATALEVGGSYGKLDPGGDLEGWYWTGRLGVRRTYDMDRPLRPSLFGGAGWVKYDQDDEGSDFDIKGPLVYVGGGMEYLFTPAFGVGTDLRGSLKYLDSEDGWEFASGVDVLVNFFYRF